MPKFKYYDTVSLLKMLSFDRYDVDVFTKTKFAGPASGDYIAVTGMFTEYYDPRYDDYGVKGPVYTIDYKQGGKQALAITGLNIDVRKVDGAENPNAVENLTSGNDRMWGSQRSETLYGNDGNDRMFGNNGNDRLFGGDDDDRIFGGSGDDALYGDNGDDRLYGGVGDERLSGGDGNDRLDGGIGSDRLSGGEGNDRLVGGFGTDLLRGGSGKDAFIFLDLKDSPAHSGRDVIQDFGRGDRIDLSAIDSNALFGGNQTFRFIGGDEFAGRAGQLRVDEGLLLADVDGDSRPEFSVEVRGLDLTGDHLIL